MGTHASVLIIGCFDLDGSAFYPEDVHAGVYDSCTVDEAIDQFKHELWADNSHRENLEGVLVPYLTPDGFAIFDPVEDANEIAAQREDGLDPATAVHHAVDILWVFRSAAPILLQETP